MEPILFMTVIGLTVAVGYIGTILFDKTKIPDTVLLIAFGLALVPLGTALNIPIQGFSQEMTDISSVLTAVALMIILFDAGLNLDFFKFLENAPKGMFFTVANMLITMFSVGAIAYVFFPEWGIAKSLLLGAILGGTSAEVILTLISKLNFSENTKMTIILESILNDTVTIMASIVLINFITMSGNGVTPLQQIMASFSVGAVLGLVIGLTWLFVLNRMRDRPFDHILTLGIVFLLFVLTEMSGGNGALSAFMFGIVLGNGNKFSEMLRLNRSFTVDKMMKTFQGEISFFMRSFFFVYLGMTFVFNQTYLIYGLVVAAVVITARFVGVRLMTIPMKITKAEANLIGIMGPRGLATTILATQLGNYVEFQPMLEPVINIILIVIMVSVIYSSVAVYFVGKQGTREMMAAQKQVPAQQKVQQKVRESS